MDENARKYIVGMQLNAPTTAEKIKDAELKLGISFPVEYKEFILETNGVEGAIGENSYLSIWSIEDIAQYNDDYMVNVFNPGLVYFGSDGGGMAFAFDNRTRETKVVTLPFESIDLEELEPCGNTFNEFLQKLYEVK